MSLGGSLMPPPSLEVLKAESDECRPTDVSRTEKVHSCTKDWNYACESEAPVCIWPKTNFPVKRGWRWPVRNCCKGSQKRKRQEKRKEKWKKRYLKGWVERRKTPWFTILIGYLLQSWTKPHVFVHFCTKCTVTATVTWQCRFIDLHLTDCSAKLVNVHKVTQQLELKPSKLTLGRCLCLSTLLWLGGLHMAQWGLKGQRAASHCGAVTRASILG